MASNLTKKEDMFRLGFNLGLKIRDIEVHLENNPGSLTVAAFNMLNNWSKGQADPNAAFTKLVEALEEAKLSRIVKDVFD